jgi:hypothetical protein
MILKARPGFSPRHHVNSVGDYFKITVITAVRIATMLQTIATIAITFARRESAAANWLCVIASRELDIASAAAAAAEHALE